MYCFCDVLCRQVPLSIAFCQPKDFIGYFDLTFDFPMKKVKHQYNFDVSLLEPILKQLV